MNWIKTLLKPLGRALAIRFVQSEGDILQGRLRIDVIEHGPKAVDSAFDVTQVRIKRGVEKLKFLPEAIKAAIFRIIMDEGDRLQARVRDCVQSGGVVGLDYIFDLSQESIISKIKSL
jgi:hypothetical protein